MLDCATRSIPQQLFETKWTTVQRLCRCRFARMSMPPQDREDLLQFAAARLWQQCLRHIENINCSILARAAYADLRVQLRGRSGKAIFPRISLDHPHEQTGMTLAGVIGASEGNIKLRHGLSYTLVDAKIDAPERVLTGRNGLSSIEVAARLGISRQRVHQIARQLGGVKVGGRWRFPATASRVSELT